MTAPRRCDVCSTRTRCADDFGRPRCVPCGGISAKNIVRVCIDCDGVHTRFSTRCADCAKRHAAWLLSEKTSQAVCIGCKQRTRRRGDDGKPRCCVCDGVKWNRSKLTPEKVVEIRKRADAGEAIRALARAYGIARNAVRCAVTRKTWRHVA